MEAHSGYRRFFKELRAMAKHSVTKLRDLSFFVEII